MQEKRKYDSLVISNTYDLERLIMYPEKAAVARTYEEIRHLISNGHVVEVRDEYSNVVVDNVEKLDMLYKPADYGLVQEDNNINPNEPAEVSTRFIRLPNGTILDTEVLMNNNNGVQPNGYNIPQYIKSTPDVLPRTTVNKELNGIKPEATSGQVKEEASKESEDKEVKEESSEENNNKKNKEEGDGK